MRTVYARDPNTEALSLLTGLNKFQYIWSVERWKPDRGGERWRVRGVPSGNRWRGLGRGGWRWSYGHSEATTLTVAWTTSWGAVADVVRSVWRFCHVRDDENLDSRGGGEDVEKRMDSRRWCRITKSWVRLDVGAAVWARCQGIA